MLSLCADADQIFRPTTFFDYGIDGEIEFKAADGNGGGGRVYVQLKSGDSYLEYRKSDRSWIFNVEKRHADYWVKQPVDVYLVIEAPEKLGPAPRWMNVTQYLKNRPDSKSRRVIFDGETVDDRAILRCRGRHLYPSGTSLGGSSGVRLVGLPPLGEPFFGRELERKRLVQWLKERQNTAVAGPAGGVPISVEESTVG